METDFSAKIGNSNSCSGRITASTSQLRHPNSFGGGCFHFFSKNRPQKHQKRAILLTLQANGGGGGLEPPPGYATAIHCYSSSYPRDNLCIRLHVMKSNHKTYRNSETNSASFCTNIILLQINSSCLAKLVFTFASFALAVIQKAMLWYDNIKTWQLFSQSALVIKLYTIAVKFYIADSA